MRVFAGGRAVLSAPRSFPQFIVHGYKVTGTYRSPRNAEGVGALGAEPIALDQQLARVWRRVAGGS
jgi:hypothetical protein